MLRRTISVAAIVTAFVAVAAPAYAGHHPVIHVDGNNNGVVGTRVVAPGHHGLRKVATVSYSSGGSGCRWVDSPSALGALPYTVHLGKGTWWAEFCPGRGEVGLPVFVPAAGQGAVRVTETPGTVARRAVKHLVLPLPKVGLDPRGQALVGLAEWFWIPRAQWRPLKQRTSAGGVWARVTARPVSTSWDPGDGSPPVKCQGPGTPYDASLPASAQSTDCSYAYTTSSVGRPQTGSNPNDRFFTVTVTTTWAVGWVGAGGTAGTLPAMTRTRSFRLPVEQRETVVTGGSG
jgi:hypothetical protein